MKMILELEKVEYDKEALQSFVVKFFPDYRRIINELQFYANTYGKIDKDILVQQDATFEEIIGYIREKSITKTRQWVSENVDNDPWSWFDLFYQNCSDYFDKSFIPALVELLADYQEKAIRVHNQEINMTAFLLSVMINAVWKK